MEYYKLAEIQLHKAIDLFLEEDYICAITLAGAAEEVLGKLIQYSLGDDCEHSVDIAVKKINEDNPEIQREKIISVLNNARNGLKHFNPDKEFHFQPVDDALTIIFRAIGNYCVALGVKTEKMDCFATNPEVKKMFSTVKND